MSVSGRTLVSDEHEELELLRAMVGLLRLNLGSSDEVERGSFWQEDFGVPPAP